MSYLGFIMSRISTPHKLYLKVHVTYWLNLQEVHLQNGVQIRLVTVNLMSGLHLLYLYCCNALLEEKFFCLSVLQYTAVMRKIWGSMHLMY